MFEKIKKHVVDHKTIYSFGLGVVVTAVVAVMLNSSGERSVYTYPSLPANDFSGEDELDRLERLMIEEEIAAMEDAMIGKSPGEIAELLNRN